MRCRGLAWVALALLGGLGAARADESVAPRFACSFDGTLTAQVAGGSGEPVRQVRTSFTEGRQGQALRLADGDGPAHVVYNPAGNISANAGAIEFLVRLDWDYTENTSRAKRAWLDIGSGGNRNRYYLHSQAGGLVFGIFDDASVVHAVYGTAVRGWQAGEWHRVTCVWDLPRKHMALAVDGVLDSDRPSNSGRGSWRVAEDSLATFHIGGWGSLATPLAGAIDELRIVDVPPKFAPPGETAPALATADRSDLRRQAADAIAELEGAIRRAAQAGVDVSYAEAVATAGRVGAWRLAHSPLKPTDDDVRAHCAYMMGRSRAAQDELAELLRDRTWEKRVPRRDVFSLKVDSDALRNSAGEEVLLVGVRNIAPDEFAELARFFNLIAWNSAAPDDWIAQTKRHGYAGQVHLFWREPLRAALADHPEMRNVGGWCGHNWAAGLCVEAPRSRQLIADTFANLRVLRREPDPAAAYMLLSAEDEYMCWCADSLGMFRQWLRGRYGSVAALNRDWGVDAETFDDVSPPRWSRTGIEPDNRAAWYDWQQFNRARTTAVYTGLKAQVRRTWPKIPVCGGTHMHLADNRWGTKGVDPEGLNASVNDVLQCETVYELPTASAETALPHYGLDIFGEAHLDFQRATSGKPATDLEYHAWMRYTGALRAQHARLPANYTYAAIARHFLHGVRAANIWVWSRTAEGAEYPPSFASSPTIPLESVEELLRAALDVRRLTPEIAALSRAPARVAILAADASFMQIHPSFARSHAPAPYITELDNVAHGSMFLDTPIGYVSERSIAAGALAAYRVVLVPAVSHLDDETLRRLLEFVEQGGQLLVTPRSFAFDEHHRPRTAPLGFTESGRIGFVGLLDEPTPAQLADPDFVERQSVNPADPRVPGAVIELTGRERRADQVRRLEGAGIRLTLAAPDDAVLARFVDNGAPAVVEVRHGAGRVVYCAIPLRPTSYRRMLEPMLQAAGVERLVRLVSPEGQPVWGVETRSTRIGGDVLVYAINLLAAPVTCRLQGDRPIEGVHDLIRNRPGQTDLHLAPLETVILRLKTGS